MNYHNVYCKKYNVICLNTSCPDGIGIRGFSIATPGPNAYTTITFLDGHEEEIDFIGYDVSGCEEAIKCVEEYKNDPSKRYKS